MPPNPVLASRIEAALESAWITFVAVGGGIYMAAVAAGATSLPALVAYAKANWVVWLGTNLIAPAIRAFRAPSASA